MIRVAFFLGPLVAVWAIAGCTPAPVVAAPAAPVASAPATPPAGAYSAPRVTPDQVRARQAKGESLVLVDVRDAGSYGRSHIEGAASAPWANLDTVHTTLPKDKQLILYCT